MGTLRSRLAAPLVLLWALCGLACKTPVSDPVVWLHRVSLAARAAYGVAGELEGAGAITTIDAAQIKRYSGTVVNAAAGAAETIASGGALTNAQKIVVIAEQFSAIPVPLVPAGKPRAIVVGVDAAVKAFLAYLSPRLMQSAAAAPNAPLSLTERDRALLTAIATSPLLTVPPEPPQTEPLRLTPAPFKMTNPPQY